MAAERRCVVIFILSPQHIISPLSLGEFPVQGFLWQANTEALQWGNFNSECVTCYNRPHHQGEGGGVKLEQGSAVRRRGIKVCFFIISMLMNNNNNKTEKVLQEASDQDYSPSSQPLACVGVPDVSVASADSCVSGDDSALMLPSLFSGSHFVCL